MSDAIPGVRFGNEPEESAATEAFDAVGFETPLLQSTTLEARLNRRFIAALSLGSLLATAGFAEGMLASIIGFGGPLAMVLLFFWRGYFTDRLQSRPETRQKFADSCYFLGFLFTMIALMVGFLPSGLLGATVSSQKILRFFGMALGATALGLIGRILVIQGGSSTGEDVRRMEANVRDLARQVGETVAAIAADLAAARTAVVDDRSAALAALIAPVEATLAAALARLDGASVAAANSMLRHQQSVDERHAAYVAATDTVVAASAAKLSELEAVASETRAAQELLAASARSLTASIAALGRDLVPLTALTREALSDATASIMQVSTALAGVRAQGATLETVLSAVAERTDDTVRAIDRATSSGNRAADTIDALGVQSERFAADLDAQLSSSRRASSEALTSDAVRFQTDIDAATERFAEIVRSFGTTLAGLRSAEPRP